MKYNYLIFVLLLSVSPLMAQQQLLIVDEYQQTETIPSPTNQLIKMSGKQVIPVVGGLDQWDGMNNYIYVFGSKLIIESADLGSDGITRLVLRREDGLDFFNLFPTLRARLVPIHMERGAKIVP
ncbi:hypothetical protein FK220_005055 [Flavobacteriaceae bacterium TP-CH-4]|uniref:Uncharacterized protein n=1 Tax=Pelagihabitans pacificus TaxID=2696054 RepID=A0A967E9Q5_9FLAO|nr:hypothetical protein [Pelagihabitans pacificus]NHF58696.1 hypothetical protein [Pelagihabitans pacificus]